jgi:hypothetical protein
MNTHDIYNAFEQYGNLISIDIWEDSAGRPDSKARIRFKWVSYQFTMFEVHFADLSKASSK